MGTKVKGFFKCLKNNISNIFDEEQEEQEIQIGMPMDVKHVAHIGADRPAAESPCWMKEFDDGSDLNSVESLDIRKGTGNHRSSRSEELNLPDMPNSSRHRHHSSDTGLDPDSERLDLSTKPKRRRQRLRRRSQETPDESPDAKAPDAPRRRNRRRRRRDDGDGDSTNSKDGGESFNNETQS